MRLALILSLALALAGCSSMPENRAYCSLDRKEMIAGIKFWNMNFGIDITESDALIACKNSR